MLFRFLPANVARAVEENVPALPSLSVLNDSLKRCSEQHKALQSADATPKDCTDPSNNCVELTLAILGQLSSCNKFLIAYAIVLKSMVTVGILIAYYYKSKKKNFKCYKMQG